MYMSVIGCIICDKGAGWKFRVHVLQIENVVAQPKENTWKQNNLDEKTFIIAKESKEKPVNHKFTNIELQYNYINILKSRYIYLKKNDTFCLK